MKKILFVCIVFLIGITTVSAQGAYEVKVDWTVDQSSNCLEHPTPWGYLVGLTIYDAANANAIVVYNAYNLENSSATSSTFSAAQTQVEDYCNAYHENTPSLTVVVAVRMYDLSSEEQFCFDKRTQSGYSCSYFYLNGVLVDGLLVTE
ncbi:MAG: hypothetical protein GXO88_13520 [Chlorobi bacterium]|nr:hypothetical protein [Chlorobiota bacterium]